MHYYYDHFSSFLVVKTTIIVIMAAAIASATNKLMKKHPSQLSPGVGSARRCVESRSSRSLVIFGGIRLNELFFFLSFFFVFHEFFFFTKSFHKEFSTPIKSSFFRIV